MSIQSIKGGLWIPRPTTNVFNTGPSLSSITLSGNGHKVGMICRAPKTGSIRKIAFLTGTVTTGETLDCRIETVDATTGDPSGTLFAANTNVIHVVANGDDNVWLTTAALTADAVVTKGDLIAVVLAFPASGALGNLQIRACQDFAASTALGCVYADQFSAAWSKQTSLCPAFALEYSDGSYETILGSNPYLAVSHTAFGSGSTPDERGIKFSFPFPFRVRGCWCYLDLDGDITVKLYDADGSSVLGSISVDKDVRINSNESIFVWDFPATYSLLANQSYRLTILPGATTVDLGGFTVGAAAVMDCFEGGQSIHQTTRTDGGAWTDTTTARPHMGLILDGFDDGATQAFVIENNTNIIIPQVPAVGY